MLAAESLRFFRNVTNQAAKKLKFVCQFLGFLRHAHVPNAVSELV